MALFTTTDDTLLEEARRQVVDAERVCPHCQTPVTTTSETLVAFNAAVGIEGHRCGACGQTLLVRRPSPDGL